MYKRQVYVAHINYEAKERELLERMLMLHNGTTAELPWGNREVIGVSMPRERHGVNRCRGFAYILWRNADLANRCIAIFHNQIFMGKRLDVKISARDFLVENCHVGKAVGGMPRLYEKVWHFPDEGQIEV